MNYYVVDYKDTNGDWRNTDQGDPDPSSDDIMASPEINIGWEDEDKNWHYRWVDGPFDADFWLDDAIVEIADEYGISIAGR